MSAPTIYCCTYFLLFTTCKWDKTYRRSKSEHGQSLWENRFVEVFGKDISLQVIFRNVAARDANSTAPMRTSFWQRSKFDKSWHVTLLNEPLPIFKITVVKCIYLNQTHGCTSWTACTLYCPLFITFQKCHSQLSLPWNGLSLNILLRND